MNNLGKYDFETIQYGYSNKNISINYNLGPDEFLN